MSYVSTWLGDFSKSDESAPHIIIIIIIIINIIIIIVIITIIVVVTCILFLESQASPRCSHSLMTHEPCMNLASSSEDKTVFAYLSLALSEVLHLLRSRRPGDRLRQVLRVRTRELRDLRAVPRLASPCRRWQDYIRGQPGSQVSGHVAGRRGRQVAGQVGWVAEQPGSQAAMHAARQVVRQSGSQVVK